MVAFHETQFPARISYGSKGGPRRLTQVVTLKSGFEERNQSWEHSRRRYDASVGLRSLGDLHEVLDFWEARRGQLYGFRWKDWADYKSSPGRAAVSNADQILGAGTGALTTFQLVKRYSDAGFEYVRPIRKPVVGTVVIAKNGVAAPTGWTLDPVTGIVTFAVAPGAGVVVTAGYEFDVPVRFENDELDLSVDAFEAGSIPAINVIEIRV
jgi:uncharacterized protein (TIGR02217 family)